MNPPDALVSRSLDDGIERVTFLPRERRFKTPILLQHGMWHGASCWEPWRAALAESG